VSDGRISAVIPVFNGAEFVADAVASMRDQTRPPDEIIVVDDASTDDSAARAEALGGEVCVVRRPDNGGLPAARNSGVEAATGELVSFLDVDDLWSADKTAVQVALLDADPDLDIVIGRTRRMRSTRNEAGEREFEPWGEAESMLSMGSALIRRRAFDRVGELDGSLAFTCDWDWFMRAREQGLRVRMHDEIVQWYRRHDANLTEDVETGNQQTLAMLAKSVQRRRASGRDASLPDIERDDTR
jgi:glycosyltransferase involved in cell wall biosynthesis